MRRAPSSPSPLLASVCVAVLGVAAALLVGSLAHASPPSADAPRVPGAAASAALARASASATALPSSEIAPPESSGRGAWDPDLSVSEIPSSESKEPAITDWKTAPVAPEVRVTQPDCKVQRIREWYRIACSGSHMERITGSTKDVRIDCHREAGSEMFCDEVYVIFPAHRGDVRAFELFRWTKWGPDSDALVSEQYLPGDRLPLISVYGIRFGF